MRAKNTLRVLTLLPLLFAASRTLAAEGHDHHAHHHPAPTPSTAPATVELDELRIPDVVLVDQAGQETRFVSDLLRGKVVVMNFIFTTCGTICPPMGAHFSRLQNELGERAGRDVRLISVSIDPLVDTPARLALWGKKFGAGPGWTLVTGKKPEVDKLLKALGVFTPDFADHSPVVLVGDVADGWTRAYGLAPPEQILGLVEERLDAVASRSEEVGR